ncbi:Calmodulin-binding transcription activator 6 [Forsythia ovata]|uniref:Calmodulin-binding transcription activator 6 n=1 Tax=Forsythia ovata TaxID=205694 RepID=A0ABD1W9D2_9LAMI
MESIRTAQKLPSGLSGAEENNDSTTIKNYEQRLHEINTLEWDELVVLVDTNKPLTPQEGDGHLSGGFFHEGQLLIPESNVFLVCGDSMVPAVAVQSGMFRCSISPQSPDSNELGVKHSRVSQFIIAHILAGKQQHVHCRVVTHYEGLYTVPHSLTLNLPSPSIAENQSLPSQLSPSHHPLIVTGENPSLSAPTVTLPYHHYQEDGLYTVTHSPTLNLLPPSTTEN